MQQRALIDAIAEFDGLPVAGLILDLEGTVMALNRFAAGVFGDDLIGAKCWRFVPRLEDLWTTLVPALEMRGEFSGLVDLHTLTGRRDGQLVASVRKHGGRRFIVAFLIEIANAGTEQEVRQAGNQRLESLGLVAGGVAHEFNNQLVSVVSDVAMVREDETLSEPTREALERIEAAAQRMTLLTRQLLAFAGKGRFVTTLLDPDLLLTDTGERLVRMMRAGTSVAIEPGAGSVAVEADRGLLRQVIVDLAENASEALLGGRGKIVVSSRIATEDGAAFWELSVSDDGGGMDAGTKARIFDPFFSTKADHRGLGLSAVLGIARRLGGTIDVESEPGQGATFRLRLPVIPGVAPPRRRSTSKQRPLEKLAGLRILVADDEPSVRATVQRLLERRSAQVVLAMDGADAERLMRSDKFDVVLLDVMMPYKTGYELVPIARETQGSSPVILMSGYSDHARGVEPPDAFLEKPFNSAMLEATIQAALRGDGNGRVGYDT